MRYVLAATVIALTALISGCGGGGGVEGAVRDEEFVDGPMYCADAGFMQYVGERETVYECHKGERDDIDEIIEAMPGDIIGCYVYIDGKAIDVSFDLSSEFTCYEQ